MQSVITRSEIIYELKKLDVFERLNILTDIWDEMRESRDLQYVSEDEKNVLLERLENYRANPDSAVNWVDLKQEIFSKYVEKS